MNEAPMAAPPATFDLVPKHWDETKMAEQLDISRRHLTHLRERRLIPYLKLGRAVRFNPSEVARALEALTIRPKGSRFS